MKKYRFFGKVEFSHRRRLTFIAFFLSFLFCLLVIQFYRLQILQGDKWFKEAQLQHQYFVVEPFQRGRFFSNTSLLPGHAQIEQPLVFDVVKYHLYADPESIDDNVKDIVAHKICSFFSLQNEEKEKIFFNLNKKCRSRRLVMWIDHDKKSEVEKWWKIFAKKNKLAKNALFFLKDFKRSYPFKTLLGQVLSTVQDEKEHFSQQAIPIGGLEQYFHPVISGKVGKRLLLRSPHHPIDAGKIVEKPIHGADIYLTINHYLQALAEKELEKGVRKANAKAGAAIIMDPFTGEILALAEYPFFNPSCYSHFFNDKTKQNCTRVRSVCDTYEPGSVFKPITLAICFLANSELIKRKEAPLFDPQEKVATSNGKFPGRSRPLKDGRCHYYLNMDLALQKSSNIYMATMIQRVIERLGENWYRQCLTEVFGFGDKTNIQLPAESPGLVPTPGKLHPNGKLEWSQDTPYSLAIGHNILANAMQLLRAYAVIANGGYKIQPTLVRRIVRENAQGEKEILWDMHKQLLQQTKEKVLDTSVTKRLIAGMKYVTKLGGSARLGDVSGFSEAGKTGTSEKIIAGKYSEEAYLAFFMGIVPANKPRFVIYIMIEEPEKKFIPGIGRMHHGGACASPVFREIAKGSLEYLGVTPDDPYGYPYGDRRRNPQKADWAQEVKALQKIYDEWNTKKKR